MGLICNSQTAGPKVMRRTKERDNKATELQPASPLAPEPEGAGPHPGPGSDPAGLSAGSEAPEALAPLLGRTAVLWWQLYTATPACMPRTYETARKSPDTATSRTSTLEDDDGLLLRRIVVALWLEGFPAARSRSAAAAGHTRAWRPGGRRGGTGIPCTHQQQQQFRRWLPVIGGHGCIYWTGSIGSFY